MNIYESFQNRFIVKSTSVFFFYYYFVRCHYLSSLYPAVEQGESLSHSENEPALLGRDNDIFQARLPNLSESQTVWS